MEKAANKELKKMAKARQDVNACVELYLKLHPDAYTCVASRDKIEKWIKEHKKDNDPDDEEIVRLEDLLRENPGYDYFHRYDDKPITFKWLRDHIGMGPDPQKTANLLTFLQNGNVIKIHDCVEYAKFIGIIEDHGLETVLMPHRASHEDVIKLYKLPQNASKYPGWDGKTLYAECQIGKESIAIYPYTDRATIGWYGVEPMSVDDIDEEA